MIIPTTYYIILTLVLQEFFSATTCFIRPIFLERRLVGVDGFHCKYIQQLRELHDLIDQCDFDDQKSLIMGELGNI